MESCLDVYSLSPDCLSYDKMFSLKLGERRGLSVADVFVNSTSPDVLYVNMGDQLLLRLELATLLDEADQQGEETLNLDAVTHRFFALRESSERSNNE